MHGCPPRALPGPPPSAGSLAACDSERSVPAPDGQRREAGLPALASTKRRAIRNGPAAQEVVHSEHLAPGSLQPDRHEPAVARCDAQRPVRRPRDAAWLRIARGGVDAGLERRLLALALEDPEPLLLHDEPIWRDGRLVGRTTSGAYGHSLGCALALGYVEWNREDRAAGLGASRWEIEIACRRHAARASLRPFYDPKSHRLER